MLFADLLQHRFLHVQHGAARLARSDRYWGGL
jgi:hypothetical protein